MMKISFILVLSIFFFLFNPLCVKAASYYVATTGNDSNPGTQSQPYKTIQKGADVAQAGDTVKIKAGTYNEFIILKNPGTNGNPITFTTNVGDECKRDSINQMICPVIVDGNGVNTEMYQGQGYGGLFNIVTNYITVSGIKVQNTNKATTNVQGIYLAGFYAKGVNHLILENNMSENTGSSGIGIWKNGTTYSQNIIVRNNVIVNAQNYDVKGITGNLGEEDISLASVQNFEVSGNEIYNTVDLSFNHYWAIGICIKESSQNGFVAHNNIHDMPWNPGIYIDAWRAGTNSTPVLKNIEVYQNRLDKLSAGISIAGECGGTVDTLGIYNNVVSHIGGSGISISDTVGWSSGTNRCNPGNGPRKNIYILGNTVDETTDWDGSGIGINTTNIENVVVKNNLVSFAPDTARNRGVGEILVRSTTQSEVDTILTKVDASHNLTFGTPSSPTWCPCKNWNTTTNSCDAYFVCKEVPENPLQTPATKVYADPLFTNPTGSADLHLQSSSPAINKGLSMSIYNSLFTHLAQDFDSVTRPQGAAFDIGAYEYTSSTPIPTATPGIVGDINHDGVVNIQDFILLSNDFNKTGGGLVSDLNNDQVVNIQDFIILSNNFGK